MKIIAISIVAGVIAFMLSGLAFAQADNAPVSGVSATAFAPFPIDEVLEVRTGRDLSLERDLVDEVRKLLRARGFQVAERGKLSSRSTAQRRCLELLRAMPSPTMIVCAPWMRSGTIGG